jgi:magnesium transporter
VLTITSIVLMTDALIAGIYGMNFEFMPELGSMAIPSRWG